MIDNKYDYNKHYKLRELCDILDIKYNSKNPYLSLNKVKGEIQLDKISKQKYRIIRELTEEEKAELRHFSNCKELLEPTIYYKLSESKDNKIRKNMKEFFELFHITNEYYRYFSYENLTEKKYEILESIDFGEEPLTTNMLLNHFVTDTHPIFRRIVLDVFNKMVDESYIVVKEYLMFGTEKYIDLGEDKDGNKIQKKINMNNEATDSEIEMFTTLKREKMEYRKFNEWSNVPYLVKNQITREILHEMGKKYSYLEYEIILNKEGLQRKAEDQNLEELYNKLNISISEKIARSQQGELKNSDIETKRKCIDALIKDQNPT